MRVIWFLLLASSFVDTASFAQNAGGQTAVDTTRIAQFLRHQMTRDGVPGLAISITSRAGLHYAAAFGHNNGRTIHPEQTFVIGSLSKALTATAVMQLVEQGQVGLDMPVQTYLPDFAPQGGGEHVTIRHLLNQRSGLQRRDGFQVPSPTGAVSASLAYTPGTAYSYSNLNYSLLGVLIERVSGSTYADVMDTQVFGPLKMTTASAAPTIAAEEPLVGGQQYWFWPTIDAAPPRFAPEALPAGFIRASALDMGRFLQAHLIADSSAGLALGAPAFQALHEPPNGGEYGYTMGWVRSRWTDTPSLQHSGLTEAYSSVMVLLPGEDFGVTIFTNVNSFTATDHLMDGVLRILREQEAITYTRNERWLRLALLGAFSLGLVGFGKRLHAWHQAGYPLHLDTSRKNMVQLGLGTAFHAALLFGIPWYMDVPLTQLPHLQPDLGYALVLGVASGVLDGVLKALLFER